MLNLFSSTSHIFLLQVHESGSSNIQQTCKLNQTFLSETRDRCSNLIWNDLNTDRHWGGSRHLLSETFCPQTKSKLSLWSVANEMWRRSQFVKCFRHLRSVLLLRKCDGRKAPRSKKLCFFRSSCEGLPASQGKPHTHRVSKQRCLAFPAGDNHNWSKYAVPCQNNYWDLWPVRSVLWSWRWEDSQRLGPRLPLCLMVDKYEAASVSQCVPQCRTQWRNQPT